MKKFFAMLSVVTMPVLVNAQSMQTQPSSFYFGASAGQTTYDTGITAITARLDEKDTGFKIFGGLDINENISVEAFYADLGVATLSGSNGQTFRQDGTTYQFTTSASINAKGTAFGGALLAGVPITPLIKPYAKIGFSSTTVKTSLSGSTTASSTKETNTEPVYGLGVDFNITKTFAVRAEYEIYKSDDNKAKYFSVGTKFRF